MDLFDSLLEIKRKQYGVNQALALMAISDGSVVRVCKVRDKIESNINVTSQLIARLCEMGLVEPTLDGKIVAYRVTSKGSASVKELREGPLTTS